MDLILFKKFDLIFITFKGQELMNPVVIVVAHKPSRLLGYDTKGNERVFIRKKSTRGYFKFTKIGKAKAADLAVAMALGKKFDMENIAYRPHRHKKEMLDGTFAPGWCKSPNQH
jgi:hypothetical protein